MSIVVVNFMQVFMGVVLYLLLGVIVAGGYRMLAGYYNHRLSLGLPIDNVTIGIICTVWPLFMVLVLLASVFSKPIGKLGDVICGWFVVEE